MHIYQSSILLTTFISSSGIRTLAIFKNQITESDPNSRIITAGQQLTCVSYALYDP